MGRTIRLLLIAGLLAGSTASIPAQQPVAEHAPDLAQEVAGVNRSLERVAVMLEQLLEHQKTDILLKRIEMRERRIAPLENELRKRQGEMETSKAELDRLESFKDDWEDRLGEAAKVDENAAHELRSMQSEFERAFLTQASRHEALEETVRRLEDDLAEGRETIEDLEAMLLERIGD